MDQCFHLFLLLRTTKTPGHKYKTNIGRPKGGEKKADWLGASGSKEWHCGQFPWLFDLSLFLLFCPIYPRVGTEEASNLTIPTRHRPKKKSANRDFLLLAKGPGKEKPSMTKNFEQSLYSSQVPKEKTMYPPVPILPVPTCTHPRKA